MHPRKRLSIKSATVGIAASVLLGLAGLTLNPAPAKAVVYCQYVEYPQGCVARAGVVLRPRPVARAGSAFAAKPPHWTLAIGLRSKSLSGNIKRDCRVFGA